MRRVKPAWTLAHFLRSIPAAYLLSGEFLQSHFSPLLALDHLLLFLAAAPSALNADFSCSTQ